jgi:hypothetical protein
MAKIKKGQILTNSKVALMVTEILPNKSGPKEVMCKCGFCNKLARYNIDDFLDENISQCKVCFEEKRALEKKTGYREGKLVGDCRILEVGNDRLKTIKYICMNCGKKGETSAKKLDNIVAKNEGVCECKKLNKLSSSIGLIDAVGNKRENELNIKRGIKEIKGFKYLDAVCVTTNSRAMAYKYTCLKCCNNEVFTGEQLLNDRDINCSQCKHIGKRGNKIITNLDWVGYTKNCRRITRTFMVDGVKHCETKCLLCGEKERVELALFLISKTILCNKCSDVEILLRCPDCGKSHIKTTMRKLIKQTPVKYKCDEKKSFVDKEDLIIEHEFEVERQYIKSKYKGKYNYENRVVGRNGLANLIIFDSTYQGLDGKRYKNCMCIEHNKFLALSNEELNNYCHEYCMDSRVIPYNEKGNLK